MLPASLPRALSFTFSVCLGLFAQNGFAQTTEPVAPPPVHFAEDVEGVEVLTRGVLHEAFADQVNLDLVTGMLAPIAPPGSVKERRSPGAS